MLGLVDRLSYAGNEAARRYLDGEIDAKAAAAWLETYGLYSPARARQRVRFVDQYRSYVINYNLGKDMVARYIEAAAGDDRSRRWTAFAELLASPRLPSSLDGVRRAAVAASRSAVRCIEISGTGRAGGPAAGRASGSGAGGRANC